MSDGTGEEMTEEILEGIKEAKRGNFSLGLKLLRNAAQSGADPVAKAWLGYCLGCEKKNVFAGIKLCREVISSHPRLADGYFALGRIYLLNGKRKNAIEILHKGLACQQSEEILKLLNSIGRRKQAPIPFLNRGNILNVALGNFLAKLGLR
jgi:tetratricopeptide (TPR) repeat protein